MKPTKFPSTKLLIFLFDLFFCTDVRAIHAPLIHSRYSYNFHYMPTTLQSFKFDRFQFNRTERKRKHKKRQNIYIYVDSMYLWRLCAMCYAYSLFKQSYIKYRIIICGFHVFQCIDIVVVDIF